MSGDHRILAVESKYSKTSYREKETIRTVSLEHIASWLIGTAKSVAGDACIPIGIGHISLLHIVAFILSNRNLQYIINAN